MESSPGLTNVMEHRINAVGVLGKSGWGQGLSNFF